MYNSENEYYDYSLAKKKVKKIKSFYYHLTCYCIIIPIIIFANLMFDPQFHWFWFSLLGWGTGLLIHGLTTFDFLPFLGRDWEERKLKELIEKEQHKTKF
ncbi:2TM domain-containing protein [Flavobacterium rhizosphaerae]|uniref:2TM domain-containing protein n=1 Tax=Flavobacterium rhizosphaerae TaxID=3163298 RepID=A0ABW8YYZ4_9FLAO